MSNADKIVIYLKNAFFDQKLRFFEKKSKFVKIGEKIANI